MRHNKFARHWWPLLTAARLPRLRISDLDHTHCTLILGAGKMTLDVYTNYLPDPHEDAVPRYGAYLADGRYPGHPAFL